MSVNLYRKSGIHSRVVLDGQIHENTPFVAPFIHEIRSNHIVSSIHILVSVGSLSGNGLAPLETKTSISSCGKSTSLTFTPQICDNIRSGLLEHDVRNIKIPIMSQLEHFITKLGFIC